MAEVPRLSELHLAERAAKQRWPIDEGRRRELMNQLHGLAVTPGVRSRTKLAAIRAYLEMDRLNLAAEVQSLQAQLEKLVAELEALRAERGEDTAEPGPESRGRAARQ